MKTNQCKADEEANQANNTLCDAGRKVQPRVKKHVFRVHIEVIQNAVEKQIRKSNLSQVELNHTVL